MTDVRRLLLYSYKIVQDQNDLVTAIHKSTLGPPADDLIILCHESEINLEMPVLPACLNVTYKHIRDIPDLLTNPPSLAPTLVRGLALPIIVTTFTLFPKIESNPEA
jgi:hypothetical protein